MSKELLEVLEVLEREKNIDKATMLEAIGNSLLTACKSHFGKTGNIKVNINAETCNFGVVAEKGVVEEVEDPLMQVSAAEAKMMPPNHDVGDIVQIPIESKSFDRIAARGAKDVILQKIREEERKSFYNNWYGQERDTVTGIVQRCLGKDLSVNLDKVGAILNEAEQMEGEVFQPTERIKLYTLEAKNAPKGSRISVSKTYPNLVKRLFESEIVEVRGGTMETKAITGKVGSRTKITMMSHDANMDPVGACVGMNRAKVNSTINRFRDEKIDIITWDDNPVYLIENALDPTKVIYVVADEDAKEAQVIVSDYQLSLAISREDQNARLAARLTGYKVDVKSETRARRSGLLRELGIQYQGEGMYEKHEGGHDAEYQEDYQGDYQEKYQGDYQDDNMAG